MAKSTDKTQRELKFVRDTVESVWIAIVLAFVLRAFILEAFIIPTGSMAPRLFGEHWDLQCPACGYEYAYGMPRERPGQPRRDRDVGHLPTGADCPQCGYAYPYRNYIGGGDRVLVLKYLYQFSSPQPWDVVVFRNPQNNRENYIKRLIGLPGETIEVVHGDIFVKNSHSDDIKIRRKPTKAQNAMWQIVYDNDYQPDMEMLKRRGVKPPRWVAAGGAGNWDLTANQGRKFIFKGGSEDPAGELMFSASRDTFLPHYGYNSKLNESPSIDEDLDICSDLKLSMVYIPKAQAGSISLTLSSLENLFTAKLSNDGSAEILCTASDGTIKKWKKKFPPLKPEKAYDIALTNLDFSIALWLDEKPVIEVTDEYPLNYQTIKTRLAQVPLTVIPQPEVKIAAAGGPSELLHVRLMRDVYYTSSTIENLRRYDPQGSNPLYDYARDGGIVNGSAPGWGTTGNPIVLRKNEDNPDLNEYFVLGDNSPQSLDGRGWSKAAPTLRLYDEYGQRQYKLGTVPQYNLIGKAMFVYWPSGFRLKILPGLPIIPNVGRMRLVR